MAISLVTFSAAIKAHMEAAAMPYNKRPETDDELKYRLLMRAMVLTTETGADLDLRANKHGITRSMIEVPAQPTLPGFDADEWLQACIRVDRAISRWLEEEP